MLKQQQKKQIEFNPLLNIFEEGMEDFVQYERQKCEEYKTRSQKHKEKIAKLQKDLNDPELKKQRNRERRQAQKAKLRHIMESMTHEQTKQFNLQRKLKRDEQKQKVKNAMLTGQVIMLDLVYQDKMNGKENKSLAKQIQLIMKTIKHVDHPPSIHLCTFQGGIKTQLQKMGYQHLPLTVHSQDIVEVGKKLGKRLVYLSPDAQLPLQKIEDDTAYILGGLIDRTILKNASLMRASKLGIQTRKLPIRQYMKSRIVLNLDHVVLMVCKYKEVNDWKIAFDFAAPKRWKKEGENKTNNDEQSQQQQEKSQKKKLQEEEQDYQHDKNS